MILEVLAEEESIEPVVRHVITSLWPTVDLRFCPFQGKPDLLEYLTNTLSGFREYPEYRKGELSIIVLVDRDDDDCHELKEMLETKSAAAGLPTLANPRGNVPRVANRVVCEELEAWFFGDADALLRAFPDLPSSLRQRSCCLRPDSIGSGTWERLLRELQRAGQFVKYRTLPKTEVARIVAPLMDPRRNTSPSFNAFVRGVNSLLLFPVGHEPIVEVSHGDE